MGGPMMTSGLNGTRGSERTVECMNVMVVNRENLAGLREAGIDLAVITAVRPLHKTLPEALLDISGVRDSIERNGDVAILAMDTAGVAAASSSGRAAIVLAMQDTSPIGERLEYLRIFRDLGVRVMQLTHNYKGSLGTGCLGKDEGLTPFGRAAIAEMNRLGIAVDLSHCGDRTTLEAISYSKRPVFCSHSNPRAVSRSPRNKPDDIIVSLAERGGIIGIATYGPIVYRGDNRRPTIDDVLDCIEYVIRLVGPDFVAVGTDTCDGRFTTEAEWEAAWGRSSNTYPEMLSDLGSWYGWKTWYAEGLESTTKIPYLREGLLQRGYSQEVVSKIMGGNALRYFDAVWSSRDA